MVELAPFQDLLKCTEAAERQALEQLALGGTQKAARSAIEFALGIVNSANQQLARSAPDIRRQLERNEGSAASVERLIRVMLAAFRFLRAHRSSAGFGALALERTLSNAMIACTNAHLGVRSWDGLMLLRSLLLEHAEAHTATGSGTGAAQAPGRSVRRPVPQVKRSANSKQGLAPPASAADKLSRSMHRMSIGKSTTGAPLVGQVHFPIEHCGGDMAFNVLVVTLLCNVLRVLAQAPESAETRSAAADLAQRSHSALEWCVRVRAADKDAMEPFLSASFRAYYMLGGGCSGRRALDIRLLAIHAYSLTSACSLRELLKYASRAALRATPPAPAADSDENGGVTYSATASYYSQVIELIQPQLDAAAASPELLEFCHHLAQVRRCSNDMAGALAACRLGAGVGAAKLVRAVLSADVLFHVAAASGSAPHELEPACAELSTAAGEVLGATARHTLSEWNALALCADIARKSAKPVLVALRQDMPAAARDSVAGALVALLDTTSAIHDTYIRRGAAEKAEIAGGVSTSVLWNHSAETCLALIQACLLCQDRSTQLQAMVDRHSKRLLAMCAEQRCSADYLRSHSTILFNHGTTMYQLKLHTQAGDALEAAIQSLSQWIALAVHRGAPLDNTVEQLCKRFEIAALAYQSGGSYSKAAQAYGRAVSWVLQHSPGAVASAICTPGPHVVVRPPSSTAWAATAAVSRLLQFVDRYVRMCATRLMRDPGELRECTPLPAHMDELPDESALRGWLYEAEAHYWRPYASPSTPAVSEALRARLELALESYGEAVPLGYARSAVELAKLSRDIGDSRAFGDHIHAALEVTKSQPDGNPYVLGAVAECYAWQAIAGIESTGSAAEEVRACTRLWTLMCNLASGDGGSSAEPLDVGYLRGVVHTMQQLVDLLMSRRMYSLGADVLLVAFELAAACERHDRSWAPVVMECLVGLGTACLLRGAVGAAAQYFGDAATRYEASVLPTHVEVASKIAYATFQLAQGDATGGQATMGMAGELAQKSLDVISAMGAGRQKREAATPETLVLLSRAAHAYSVLALKQGALADSIDFGIHSYRILSSLLKSLAAAHRRAVREQSRSAVPVDAEDDPFSDPKPSQDDGDGPAAGEADDAKADAEFAAFSGNWQLQRLLLDVLAHLADVYSVRGSTKEIDYFLKKALELAVQIQAPHQEEYLRLRETSMLSRKSMWDECAKALQRLHSDAVPGDAVGAAGSAIGAAGARVVEGDAWRRCGNYRQARAAYAQAMRLVERVGDSDAVAEIHAAQQAGLSEATPRLQRILGGVVPLKPRVPEPAASGTTLVAAVREDVEIRQRLVSALGGLADEDQMPIGASDQVPVHRSIDQRPDHMLLQAQLAFANLQRVLAADEVWGLVLRSAHMLPALRQARAQKPRKNTAKALAKSGLEALDALLLETLAAAITVGSAHVVHEGSHLLALVRAMRAAFGLGPAAATSGAAVASIVDDCRNVTVMREVVDAMRRRKEQVPPRLTAWPAHIAGDGLLGPSAMAWPQPSPSGSPVLGMRSGLRGSPVLGALPVPDVDTQLEPHFERAVDGKQVTAAWDAQEAVTGGWEPPDGALPAILPQNWVVCGLSIDQQRDVLFVTRYVHGRQPAVLCLPMRGAAEPQSDSGLSDSGPAPGRSVFDSTYRQLRGIIAQSDETMKTGSACTTEGEKRAWWEHRTSLDRQLGELLTSIEDEWLGGFRSVLEPTDTSCTDAESLRASIGHCVVSSLPKSYATKAKAMELSAELCALVHGVARRTVCRAGAEDGDSSSAAENDWLDVCSLLWDVYFYQGAAPPSDEDGLGLFAARLAGALKAGAAAADVCTSVGEGARPHLLLVLDKHAQQIPWECLPCIRDYSVSRVPSVTILRERILAMRADTARGSRPRPDMSAPGGLLAFSSLGGLGPGPNLLSSLVFDSPPRDRGGCGEAGPGKPPGAHVDGTSVFYVLNPEGDLHRTQANFEAYLQGQASWRGAVGRPPMNNECESGLSSSDVFLYFGHGGAERYISRSQIRALDRCAVALLLGCSSGQLKLAGEYDALGTATDYLIGGCPALVGNLWDVGDKDIDRFAASLLQLWGLDRHSPVDIAVRLDGDHGPRQPAGPVSLADAVCWARRACRMPFLTGAAPVVYGIPAYLSQ